MLRHVRPRRRRDERDRGRDVERARLVAAGAAGVEQRARHVRERLERLAHRAREAGDLVDGLAAHAQRDREARDLRGRGRAGEDVLHDAERLLFRQ